MVDGKERDWNKSLKSKYMGQCDRKDFGIYLKYVE